MTDFTYQDFSPAIDVDAQRLRQSLTVLSGHRSPVIAILMVIPVLFGAISWMADGIPTLTDLAFIILSVLCVVGLLLEIRSFPTRFGIGGMVLDGGTLIWFCHDYFDHWFNVRFTLDQAIYDRAVVAKGAFFTCLFVWASCIGIFLPVWNRIARVVDHIPEPAGGSAYLMVIFAAFFLGLIPYLFFSAEPFYVAIGKSMIGMRTKTRVPSSPSVDPAITTIPGVPISLSYFRSAVSVDFSPAFTSSWSPAR